MNVIQMFPVKVVTVADPAQVSAVLCEWEMRSSIETLHKEADAFFQVSKEAQDSRDVWVARRMGAEKRKEALALTDTYQDTFGKVYTAFS